MLSCTSGQVKNNRNLHIYKETYTFKYFLLKLWLKIGFLASEIVWKFS